MKLKFEKTERGFDVARFKDEYGLDCSLQKSSRMYPDCVWLGVSKHDRMHLDRKMAKALSKALKKFVKTGELT